MPIRSGREGNPPLGELEAWSWLPELESVVTEGRTGVGLWGGGDQGAGLRKGTGTVGEQEEADRKDFVL